MNPNEEEQQQNSEQSEMQEPNEIPVPPVPTAEEWKTHQITHITYRPWCEICEKNAAMNTPHKMLHQERLQCFVWIICI